MMERALLGDKVFKVLKDFKVVKGLRDYGTRCAFVP